MTQQQLLITIVPHGRGEATAAAATAAGAPGGTLLLGRGTAGNALLQLLGLGDTSKDLLYALVPRDVAPAVREAIRRHGATQRAHFGVMFALDALSFFRGGDAVSDTLSPTDTTMNTEPQTSLPPPSRLLINVVVNKGYADDAMAAARRAGATGGTVLTARGTARPGDAKFFGVPLVPEKEMLFILVDREKADAVVGAIRALPCLAEKGSGIVYTLPVTDFSPLGKSPESQVQSPKSQV